MRETASDFVLDEDDSIWPVLNDVGNHVSPLGQLFWRLCHETIFGRDDAVGAKEHTASSDRHCRHYGIKRHVAPTDQTSLVEQDE